MPDTIIVPTLGDKLIDDDGATILMHTWMELITSAVNNIPPFTGSGTPEGTVEASVGRWYVDTAAAAGTGIYFKETGDGATGWILRS